MYLLTLLAFSFHQIFELTDGSYKACRKKFGSKRYLWERLRGAIQFFIFDSWTTLLNFLLEQREDIKMGVDLLSFNKII
ncbi:MAG: hypothetical protein COB83_12845 [Gammaproteobacteria bacterium]|nr:MAG: hypothetical protein COB83_12845 [Gammaproteobacteria bacterium]